MHNLITKARPALANSRFGRFLTTLRHRGEAGMATAEYAIGVMIVIGIGGIIIKIITDGTFRDLVLNLIKFVFTSILAIQ